MLFLIIEIQISNKKLEYLKFSSTYARLGDGISYGFKDHE